MAFQISPGLEIKEIDLTLGVRGVSTSKGGFAGQFEWGPIEQRTLVSDEDELVDRFGYPNDVNAAQWFTASSFLAYANALEVVRVAGVSSAAITASITNEDATSHTFAAGTFSALKSVVSVIFDASLETETTSVVSGAALASFAANTFAGAAVNPATAVVTFDDGVNPVATLTSGTDYVLAIAANGSATVTLQPAYNLGAGFPANGTVAVAYNAGGETLATSAYTLSILPNGGGTLTLTGGATFGAVGALTINVIEYAELNATDGVSGIMVKNDDDYEARVDATSASVIGRYAGSKVNGYEVHIIDDTTWATADATVKAAFDSAPVAGEIHVAVVDNTGVVRESYPFLSPVPGAQATDGSNKYVVDVIKNKSKLVYIGGGIKVATDANTPSSITATGAGVYTLAGGQDAAATGVTTDLTDGMALFDDGAISDISLLMTGAASIAEQKFAVENVAAIRKDVVAFISPQRDLVVGVGDASTVVQNLTEATTGWRDALNIGDADGTYAFADCNWKYTYDRYNDKYRWVPCNGDIAGLAARTDNVADPWYSPGGYTRGVIKGAIKLAWNPSKKSYRDELYKKSINPVLSETGQGSFLLGDKTLMSRPSAFDRINVRRLFIVLEKAISNAAKFLMFEFNDPFTRAQFRALVTPFLRDVQGRRGIYDFRVKCDETNNTGEVVDRNEFVGSILVKPAKSINFITLNFVAVRTAVSFEEIEGIV